MAKFHINPDTGEALPCSAAEGSCPYGEGTIHGSSINEARNLYEESQKDNLFTTKKKEESERYTYYVPMHAVERARSIIEKTNKRLARQGIEERFTAEEEVKTETYTDIYGVPRSKEFVNFHLNAPSISYNGYEFLAVVDKEDGGLVTRTAQNVELNGWRPKSQACEHCGQTRHRSKTYLIKGPDGERHQIGSTCVESYLGIKPEGLWALGFNPLEKLDDDEEFQRDFSKGQSSAPVDYTLAMALAVSDDGENFVSKSFGYDNGISSTYDMVGAAIDGANSKDGEWRKEMHDKADEYIRNGRVAEIKKYIEEMDGTSDYVTNLKTIAKGEWVSPKASGTLISALSAERKRKQAEKNAVDWKPGYTAPVGTSVKGMKMKVLTNDVREVSDPYNYVSGTTFKSRMVFQDEEGHQVVWWASRKILVDEGTEVELKGGKVKKHDQYNGIDQTVLERVKVEEKDPSAK